MASRTKDSKVADCIIGPILTVVAVSALWKNETRFDYFKAARNAVHAPSLPQSSEEQVLSYTGDMDQSLELSGKYIETFTGYLIVHRSAEIYCWDRDEDDEGFVTWSMEWMSSVENNSRNDDVKQKLKSGRLLPPNYQVGDLTVNSKKLEFVDSRETILPGPLPKAAEGADLGVEGPYLTLNKGRSNDLGDERISFRAIPVPPTATWFGRFSGGKGVADTREERQGMINRLIKNTGVLHHLVAGERDVALITIRRHIKRLKWIVRGIGTLIIVGGLLTFFDHFLKFLYPIPIIGQIAETGAFLAALILGLPLAVGTIVIGFVAENPLFLIPILLVLIAGIWLLVYLSKKQQKTGQAIRQSLEAEQGQALETKDLKKLEYREMAGLLASSGNPIGTKEIKTLDGFAKKSGFEAEDRATLLQEVQDTPPPLDKAEFHLENLIRLALADAVLTPQEVRSIREAATQAGYSRSGFRKLMAEVTKQAESLKAS